jgi:hypothetical protein
MERLARGLSTAGGLTLLSGVVVEFFTYDGK